MGNQQPYNQKLDRMIRSKLQTARDRVDKRPIDDQIKLKNRYQKSHGLVLKGIPLNVPRQVVFHAIEKLGSTLKDANGELTFPGECKMRTFMYPQIKAGQKTRNAFPIFVNKKDQMFIYQWSKNQNGQIQLEPEPTQEFPDFKPEDWNGFVIVEKVRGSDGETDYASEIPISTPLMDPSLTGGYGAQTPATPPLAATPPPGSNEVASQLAHVLNLGHQGLGGALPTTPPNAQVSAYPYTQSPISLPLGQGFVRYDPRNIHIDSLSGCSTPMSQMSDCGYYDRETGQWVQYPLPTTSPVLSYDGAGSFNSDQGQNYQPKVMQFQQFAAQLEDPSIVAATGAAPPVQPVVLPQGLPAYPQQSSPMLQNVQNVHGQRLGSPQGQWQSNSSSPAVDRLAPPAKTEKQLQTDSPTTDDLD